MRSDSPSASTQNVAKLLYHIWRWPWQNTDLWCWPWSGGMVGMVPTSLQHARSATASLLDSCPTYIASCQHVHLRLRRAPRQDAGPRLQSYSVPFRYFHLSILRAGLAEFTSWGSSHRCGTHHNENVLSAWLVRNSPRTDGPPGSKRSRRTHTLLPCRCCRRRDLRVKSESKGWSSWRREAPRQPLVSQCFHIAWCWLMRGPAPCV